MRPDLIAQNFANAEYARDAGVVMCRFYREGAWREVPLGLWNVALSA